MSSRAGRILIVDDEAAIRELLQRFLRSGPKGGHRGQPENRCPSFS